MSFYSWCVESLYRGLDQARLEGLRGRYKPPPPEGTPKNQQIVQWAQRESKYQGNSWRTGSSVALTRESYYVDQEYARTSQVSLGVVRDALAAAIEHSDAKRVAVGGTETSTFLSHVYTRMADTVERKECAWQPFKLGSKKIAWSAALKTHKTCKGIATFAENGNKLALLEGVALWNAHVIKTTCANLQVRLPKVKQGTMQRAPLGRLMRHKSYESQSLARRVQAIAWSCIAAVICYYFYQK